MMPAIYDNATHYVINQKITLEMLKEISHSEDVLEVAVNILVALEDLVHPINIQIINIILITICRRTKLRDKDHQVR